MAESEPGREERADDAGGVEGAAEAEGVAAGAAERPRSDEELFAELVAVYEQPELNGPHSWPDAENLSSDDDMFGLRPQPRPRPTPPLPAPGPAIRPLPRVDALTPGPGDPRAWTPAENPDDDHFTPPDPEPMPAVQLITRMSLLAVVAGVALMLLSGFGQLPGLAGFLGAVAFIGGVAGLVSRLRHPEDDDDDDYRDPHSGAVV